MEKKLKELSMPKFTRAIHLRFPFAGTITTPDDTYDPKYMCDPIGRLHIGPYHQLY